MEQEIAFSDISIEIGYDSDALELTGIEENSSIGASFTKAQNLSVNPYNMNWASPVNITYSGTLATLVFNVKTDKAGIYPITVDYYKGRNGNYIDGKNINYDEQFNALNLIYTPGSVTVETENKIIVTDKFFTMNLKGNTNAGKVYISYYDNSNNLLLIKTYTAREYINFETSVPLATYYAKVMWWNNTIPMCKEETVNLR